jgi:hypothetical protein
MRYTIEMMSGGIICLPSFMTFGSGFQIIISLLPQQSIGITDRDVGICEVYCCDGVV